MQMTRVRTMKGDVAAAGFFCPSDFNLKFFELFNFIIFIVSVGPYS